MVNVQKIVLCATLALFLVSSAFLMPTAVLAQYTSLDMQNMVQQANQERAIGAMFFMLFIAGLVELLPVSLFTPFSSRIRLKTIRIKKSSRAYTCGLTRRFRRIDVFCIAYIYGSLKSLSFDRSSVNVLHRRLRNLPLTIWTHRR